ncbi:cupin [Flavobacteriaceae bacterium S356]|uniref:Cupin n=1 Tax=Asprobacillus argus TaxID=3076534 RepID=A0ABU3LC00_9FLAO|nr:cupin [Flavobacteriaceae bacterium S356]
MKTASLYKDLEYHKTKPLINVLLDTPFTKEIRISMQKGVLMKKHKTAFPIVVNVVEGAIDFGVQETSSEMKKGDLIALESDIYHDLKAIEDSIVRLTLTKYDNTDRVKNVVDN